MSFKFDPSTSFHQQIFEITILVYEFCPKEKYREYVFYSNTTVFGSRAYEMSHIHDFSIVLNEIII